MYVKLAVMTLPKRAGWLNIILDFILHNIACIYQTPFTMDRMWYKVDF